MKKVFTMECISPTPTFIKGKRYIVVEYDNSDSIGKFINENGNMTKAWSFRFKNLQIEEKEEDMKLKCINSKFKNITVGKEYKVLTDSGNFVVIRNDKNIRAKYSKKYFKTIEDDQPVVAKPTHKDPEWICVIPTKTLSYKKKYKLTPVKGEADYVEVVDNDRKKIKVLRKRFKQVK